MQIKLLLVLFVDVPSAPVGLRVTEVDVGKATLVWDRPLSDGGSPITQYHVDVCRSGVTGGWTRAVSVDSSTLTITLTGLHEGDFYFARVFAENQAGLSKKASDLVDSFCARKPLSMLFVNIFLAFYAFGRIHKKYGMVPITRTSFVLSLVSN